MTYDPLISHSTFTLTVIYVRTIQIGMVQTFIRPLRSVLFKFEWYMLHILIMHSVRMPVRHSNLFEWHAM
jgi:hypothetical protein